MLDNSHSAVHKRAFLRAGSTFITISSGITPYRLYIFATFVAIF